MTPGLPTLAQSGLPGYVCTALYATFAPLKTPPAIVKRINQEMVTWLKRPDVRERFLAASAEVYASTPEVLRTTMTDEIARFGKVIKAANIKLD